jgi:predicted amidohydrolase YtcJ
MLTLWHNGRIYPRPTDAPVPALAVTGGCVAGLGEASVLRARWGAPEREIDLEGRAVVPGLIDAHCHLLAYGLSRRREADLRGAGSIAAIQERLQRHAATVGAADDAGRWLLGRGFEQERLAEGRWPTRDDLDRVRREQPIRITRVCGHALVVNSAAMRRVGMEPSGDGRFTEDAMAPFFRALPPPDDAEWLAAARWATHEAAATGWTGVHCLLTEAGEIRALQTLHEAGELLLRVRIQLPFRMLEAAEAMGLRTSFGDDWLRLGAVKLFADGSLGARTAALRAPYNDDPGNVGTLLYPQEELDRRVAAIDAAGFQVAIHAIGDAALEAALIAIERRPQGVPRPRVEHASLAPPDLRARMRDLGVVAAVQPPFVLSDTWMAERVGPERLPWAYPFRTMRAEGLVLAGSTDCPVEALDAWAAVAAAVTGRPTTTSSDQRPTSDESISIAEALEIFTLGSAYAGGDERRVGALLPGYCADFVVLDDDPFTIPAEQIAALQPAMTVVGDAITYERGAVPSSTRST